MTFFRFAILITATLLVSGCAVSPTKPKPMPNTLQKTLVIGHRGASALRPEHTLAAYAKAIDDGADMIEPDLVSTRDGILVARHENEISGTTDVAARPEFASRKANKSIDGERVSGWFTEDFTLAELKTLRARERLPELRSTQYDGQFEIATLTEIITLLAKESKKQDRIIGLIPEIKHSTYFASIGLAMEDKLLAGLADHPYTQKAPIMIQSFETSNLRALHKKIGKASNITLLQLMGRRSEHPYDTVSAGKKNCYGDMMSLEGLREIANYADAVGPAYRDLDPQRSEDGTMRSALVNDAHALGLQVHVYTFRPENYFLEKSHRNDAGELARNEVGAVAQIRDYLALGIDAFFTDDPALGRRAVDGG